jgi:alpha-tubulin suppressor-like RCC1 family protein
VHLRQGQLYLWGRNDAGQLGRGHTDDDSCHLEVAILKYNNSNIYNI